MFVVAGCGDLAVLVCLPFGFLCKRYAYQIHITNALNKKGAPKRSTNGQMKLGCIGKFGDNLAIKVKFYLLKSFTLVGQSLRLVMNFCY